MVEFTYNQTIEYIDGTRDLNFEAARRWAEEHETTFEEDIDQRDMPKRFFVIGSEPVVETPPEPTEPIEPPEPTEEERNALRIVELQHYLNATDWYVVRFAETGIPVPADLKAERQAAREEISRLRESGGDNG